MTGSRCTVERLRLHRFRNYGEETVAFSPGLNLIVGANAQGKTNLLEAVATVALTRSPRAASAAEVIGWGADECALDADIRAASRAMRIAVRLRRSENGAVRTLRIDGTPQGARAALGLCPIVLFWPDDLQLVKGGPEGRRRLLDTLLSQLDARAADDLVRYRRALEQRNALLRQARAGQASLAGLDAFTERLVEHGAAVRVARRGLVATLTPLAAQALDELSGGGELLGLRYLEGDAGSGSGDVATTRAAFAAELGARRHEEVARGVTVAGPHRDDLEVDIAGRPARAAASQGQQRSIVLALKLAEVRHLTGATGMAPVLVLDDVLSELDAERRARLLALLGAGRSSQALITTSEPDVVGGTHDAVHRLSVRHGEVEVVPGDGAARLAAG